MLLSLHVRNYILIDSLDIAFPEGLIIITGQTGAGKSILLGALSLLSGTKADASAISEGADSCVVEAEFSLGADESLGEILSEEDIDSDGGTLLVRRVVSRSGRSRCFVNDCPVQIGLLQKLSERLIDIHSQHKSLLLTDHRFQLSMLDHFAGNSALLSDCRAAWKEVQTGRSELEELRERLSKLDADRDYNSAQFKQLDEAALKPDELELLEEEHKSLANAEQIRESLGDAISSLDSRNEVPGVAEAMREASRSLEHAARFLPSAAPLVARLDSARIELEDIKDEMESLFGKADMSPERLEAVEDRLSLLYSLLKKHNCRTVAELIAVRDSLGESLFDSSAVEERIKNMEKKISASYSRYRGLCDSLTKARHGAAEKFASSISDDLHFLELDRAVFKADVSDAQEGPDGRDKVAFLFSSTGMNAVDVAKCASGGELSRIMLCLKAMMARFEGMPTLIFDEIDTGVSGSVADRMGQMICRMGGTMQVFSITHLPQVAAKGDAHYLVEKSVTSDGRTVSGIRRVSGDERVREIARLLSGEAVTDAAIANARVLLESR